MSSHREAPEIAKDPVADSTDVYAFVSPDAPDTVTLIVNYVPFENPDGGPNFYEFGNDVLYEINIDNNGDARPDVTYQFQFTTRITNPNTFLYNTGPITSLTSPAWNRRQFFTVTRVDRHGKKHVLGRNLACPPCNIGPLSTPNYATLANAAIHSLPGGGRVFAGQRADPFFVDVGSVFDLLNLRPLQTAHLGGSIFASNQPGVNGLDRINVHSIALQVPISDVRQTGKHMPKPEDPRANIGVWTAASRQQVRIKKKTSPDHDVRTGTWLQVSRLANPLFNEVLVAMPDKDDWNQSPPADDKVFEKYVAHPEIANLLPVLYPGQFPHLAALDASGTPRSDLIAILLTGIPVGVIPGFQNSLGTTEADMVRLNTSIPPATEATQNPLGVIAGDFAGFPNGRRPTDDVVTVELRAIAGLTVPLIDPTYVPDAVISSLTDGLTAANVSSPFLQHFPYLGVPYDGYHNPS